MTKHHAQFNHFVCPSASDVPISLLYGTNAHSSVDTQHTGTRCALTACLSNGHIARRSDFKTTARDPVPYRTGPTVEAVHNVHLPHRDNCRSSAQCTQFTDSSTQNRGQLCYTITVLDSFSIMQSKYQILAGLSITQTDRPSIEYVSVDGICHGRASSGGTVSTFKGHIKQTKYPKFRFGMRRPTESKRAGQYFERLKTSVAGPSGRAV